MMATTMFFEDRILDKERKTDAMDIEFGRSSFYKEDLVYLTVDGHTVIMNEEQGKSFCESMRRLGDYLGYK
jgi:hypothetical protein